MKPRGDVVDFIDFAPAIEDFGEAVLRGLAGRPKSIPAKFFYDARGSELFEAICKLPEYYPTRTELALLRRHAGDIAALIGPRAELIELGSGASRKVGLLLDALDRPAGYTAIDISRSALRAATARIAQGYPRLAVTAICADYTQDFTLPRAHGRRVVFFPGSTIGNMVPAEARDFLRQWAALLPGEAMLIGADLRKDEAVLHAAYNDAQGVTAAFNLNLLARINRELDGDFDLDEFDHRAFFNPRKSRIEMHLASRRAQIARVLGRPFRFRAGETIHTENSYKYTPRSFRLLATAAGFRTEAQWVDPVTPFGLFYLRAV